MAESSTESLGIAKALLSGTLVLLPLWLASVRYFVDDWDFEQLSNEKIANSGATIFLAYTTLLASFVYATVPLVEHGGPDVSKAIHFLRGFAVLTGIGAFGFLIQELPEGRYRRILKWSNYGLGIIFVGTLLSGLILPAL